MSKQFMNLKRWVECIKINADNFLPALLLLLLGVFVITITACSNISEPESFSGHPGGHWSGPLPMRMAIANIHPFLFMAEQGDSVFVD